MMKNHDGSMPFAIIAVAILLMASFAGAVAITNARNNDETDSLKEETEVLDDTVDEVESYVDRELGILILDISKNHELGTLDDRAVEFENRAKEWMDFVFPIEVSGKKVELVEYEIKLIAEAMGSDSFGTEMDGYKLSYLRGTGSMTLKVATTHGTSEKEVSISTDGSYALPLAAAQGSLFENMCSDGGVSIAQIMTYQLTSLAQSRVLSGYGSQSQYGAKGTESIITKDDVKEAYSLALDIIGTICFHDSNGNEIHDHMDLAEMLLGDGIEIDLAAFYGQVLMSVIDDIAIKWFDYICGNIVVDALDKYIGVYKFAIETMKCYMVGKNPYDASDYIEAVMKDNGIDESKYRYPGTGTTTVSVGGYTVTVDNPKVDIFKQGCIKNFKQHYDMNKNYISDFIRQILNTAAQEIFNSEIEPLRIDLDAYDETSFIDVLSEAFENIGDDCETVVEYTVTKIISDEHFVDPLYAAIADTIEDNASGLAATEELRKRIDSELEKVCTDQETLSKLKSSKEVDSAIHSYQYNFCKDLEIYTLMKNVEGGQPGIIMKVLSSITGFGLKASGITSSVSERADSFMNEIIENMRTNPYADVTDLPGADCFVLYDENGNETKESFDLEYINEPIISKVRIDESKCVHTTGFREDLNAAYSTVFVIEINDVIDYKVEGKNTYSSAMGSSITSSMRSSFSNDITIEIPVASAWALMGITYSSSTTIIDDAIATLMKLLEPIMEPLRDLMRVIKDIVNALNDRLIMIASYAAEALSALYNAIIDPLTTIVDWITETIEDAACEAFLKMYFSLDLSKQSFTFEYLGYKFTLDFNVVSLASTTKTLFTATLSGPAGGLDFSASLTAKVKGDIKASNLFFTGKCTIKGNDWKISVSTDPLMRSSKHLMSMNAEIRDVNIDLVIPDMESYTELGVSLNDLPGLGEMLGSIPIPGLGINIGLNAGFSMKYSAPVKTGLLINEFESNPAGKDDGSEWIELFNNTSSTIDLTGYKLIASSDSRKKVMTLSGSIAPGEFLVIEPTFTLNNGGGKNSKNGECLTLKDPEGVEVDKTGSHKDSSDDSKTWQRTYDGSSDWELREGTMGRSNGNFVTGDLLSASDVKGYAFDALKTAFSENGSITDLQSMEKILTRTLVLTQNKIIDKVAGCLVEGSIYVSVDVRDATSSVSTGLRLALRCDSELAEDVMKYVVGKVEEMVLGLKNPYKINCITMFTDNIDLEVTVDANIGMPKIISDNVEGMPHIDIGVTFRANISAIAKVLGHDVGTPGVECGVRIIDCPAEILPSKLSAKKNMNNDLWLFRANIEWT